MLIKRFQKRADKSFSIIKYTVEELKTTLNYRLPVLLK